ncbi:MULTISPECIES: DUF2993 domain-containing protein [unclassified Microbacterium]|uniref:LmeA family phospholipid-binding protein n=1 Tax=unclassified Microbacterium TaxID=2609290 RepID=UPI00214C4FBC|nr:MULTISPECIES: DUF2993 domain-containing protein [unclassified Microbacterium]MCR2785319.1 DUF2993 domain-containing protein [Microbacterium sp. zg.B96]MDL5353188.1 DUF2993 domain-containing protein [Microbacterium sp. zg-YB36]WIM16846.1 DUF2993 domain-containing protein [Microbacterium sp. zg-B96]
MTGDTHPTQPLPDPAAQWVLSQPDAAPRRRRRWLPWLIAGVIVVVLAIVAWFAAEAIARNLVVTTVRQQIISTLSLPEDQQIDVQLTGAVIPQLIGGSLSSIRIATDDVELGQFAGDVAVEAHDVPVRGDGPISAGRATVTVDQAQLQRLMTAVDGFPVDSLGIAEPDITASMDLMLFGATIPVGLSLTPSADEGQLVLTPSGIRIAGSDITADELRRQFGIVSNAVLRDWPVCIAEHLPAGLTLTDVTVDGDVLRARFDIADAILVDPALQADGTCA